MNSRTIRKMVITAILIALAIAFQNLRLVLGGTNTVSTYIISSLVNLCLIVASCTVGLWSGLSIALITPLIALMQGHALLPMVPWIIGGNAVLVLCYSLLIRRGDLKVQWLRWIIVGVTAAALKFAVICLGQTLMLSSTKGLVFQVALGTAAAAQVQQLITAAIAMLIARMVIIALPSNLKDFTA